MMLDFCYIFLCFYTSLSRETEKIYILYSFYHMCVHFQIIYYVKKYRIRIIVIFFTKARRKTRPHFTQVWQKTLVRDGITNLDFVNLQHPFKWNFKFCLCLLYSKVPDVLMGTKKNPLAASLACKSMRKRSFSVHLLAILPQQFWLKPTFVLQRIRKWLCETNTCFDFFFFRV